MLTKNVTGKVSGSRNFTLAITSGYKFLCTDSTSVSGADIAKINDYYAAQSGNNIFCQYYVYNPQTANLGLDFRFIIIRNTLY